MSYPPIFSYGFVFSRYRFTQISLQIIGFEAVDGPDGKIKMRETRCPGPIVNKRIETVPGKNDQVVWFQFSPKKK